VLVCGLTGGEVRPAAGFALFDAGLQPTSITDPTVVHRWIEPGALGMRLWEHHFKHTERLSEVFRA